MDVTSTKACLQETEIAFFAEDDDGNLGTWASTPRRTRGGSSSAREHVDLRARWCRGRYPRAGRPTGRHAGLRRGSGRRSTSSTTPRCRSWAPRPCSLSLLRRRTGGRRVGSAAEPGRRPPAQTSAGVGPVRVDPFGGEEQETLELVELNELEMTELEKVRQAAARLDTRAYEVAPTGGPRRRPSRSSDERVLAACCGGATPSRRPRIRGNPFPMAGSGGTLDTSVTASAPSRAWC